MRVYYNRKLKERARKLRKKGTLAEAILWNELKQKKINGYQFLRQKPIDHFIVDFYSRKLKLIIEVDGCSHDALYERDKERQKKLESLGYHFLRIDDDEVKNNIMGVVEVIKIKIAQLDPNTPHNSDPPLARGDL